MRVFLMLGGVSHFSCSFALLLTISFQSMQLKIGISFRVYCIFLKAKLYLIFIFPVFIYIFTVNLILHFNLKKTSLPKREHWRFLIPREKMTDLTQIIVSWQLMAYFMKFEFPNVNSLKLLLSFGIQAY